MFILNLKYFIIYCHIILYFTVLLSVVIIFIVHRVYKLYSFYRQVSGCLCRFSLMLKFKKNVSVCQDVAQRGDASRCRWCCTKNWISFYHNNADVSAAAENNCSETPDICHEKATCMLMPSDVCVADRPSSYTCVCNKGYTGDGSDCQGEIHICAGFFATNARNFGVAAPTSQSGILSFRPSEYVPALTPSTITSRPTVSSRPFNPLSAFPVRLRLGFDHCARIQIIFTYLFTYSIYEYTCCFLSWCPYSPLAVSMSSYSWDDQNYTSPVRFGLISRLHTALYLDALASTMSEPSSDKREQLNNLVMKNC